MKEYHLMSRRQFLKAALTTTAGAAVLPVTSVLAESANAPPHLQSEITIITSGWPLTPMPTAEEIERKFRAIRVLAVRPVLWGAIESLKFIRGYQWVGHYEHDLQGCEGPMIFAANHRSHARPQDARRQERQLVGLPVKPHGVAGVVAPLVADHDLVLVGEQVDDFALGFVAPLQTDDTSPWHSTVPPRDYRHPIADGVLCQPLRFAYDEQTPHCNQSRFPLTLPQWLSSKRHT